MGIVVGGYVLTGSVVLGIITVLIAFWIFVAFMPLYALPKLKAKNKPLKFNFRRKSLMKNKIKAVSFDLGETFVSVESVPEIFYKILKAHGIERSIAEISAAWERANKRLSVETMTNFNARFLGCV